MVAESESDSLVVVKLVAENLEKFVEVEGGRTDT